MSRIFVLIFFFRFSELVITSISKSLELNVSPRSLYLTLEQHMLEIVDRNAAGRPRTLRLLQIGPLRQVPPLAAHLAGRDRKLARPERIVVFPSCRRCWSGIHARHLLHRFRRRLAITAGLPDGGQVGGFLRQQWRFAVFEHFRLCFSHSLDINFQIQNINKKRHENINGPQRAQTA